MKKVMKYFWAVLESISEGRKRSIMGRSYWM